MWRVSATSCSSLEFEESKSKKSSNYELKKEKLLERESEKSALRKKRRNYEERWLGSESVSKDSVVRDIHNRT